MVHGKKGERGEEEEECLLDSSKDIATSIPESW
jgi:hypothetical protein